jgi:molecular chaperone HscC
MVMEVHASAGDYRLSGEDVNETVIDLAKPRSDPDSALAAVDPVMLRKLPCAAARASARAGAAIAAR